MAKKKEVKMVDPPRYPKVTNPLDKEMKKLYGNMVGSMVGMLKVALINNLKENQND